MGVLHDWRGLREVPSAEEIRRRAGSVSRLGVMRWALVVAGDAGYGTGRMAELLTRELRVQIRAFRGVAEAEAWARGK